MATADSIKIKTEAFNLESVDIQASQMMAAARATKEANRCASLS